jgi:hypothetical protein
MQYHKEKNNMKNVCHTSNWSTLFTSCAQVTIASNIVIKVLDKYSENIFIWGIRPFLFRCEAPAATDMNLRVTVAGNWDSCTRIYADTLALRFSPLMTSCDKLNFKWFCIQRAGRVMCHLVGWVLCWDHMSSCTPLTSLVDSPHWS